MHGLRAAAAHTELNVTIPTQPYISETHVNYFMSQGGEDAIRPKTGSAIAWIAHLNLLSHVVQSGFETSLIIEDDADWSIDIKQQMLTLSDKVRQYTETPPSDMLPYGSGWDVLWLGHCGEWYSPELSPNVLSWPDETTGRREDWRGVYDRESLKGLAEGHRHLFWSRNPICTYAYAVTHTGAQKILEWASDGQNEAYDIHLQNGCQRGGLKCISVVDQLFHHYRPPPEIGQGSDILGSVSEEVGERIKVEMGSTAVILNSARCKALFNSTCYDTVEMKDRPF